jgi:hypothetical protein
MAPEQIDPGFHSNRRTHRLSGCSSGHATDAEKSAEQTRQTKWVVLANGLFPELANKAFRRGRIASPPIRLPGKSLSHEEN